MSAVRDGSTHLGESEHYSHTHTDTHYRFHLSLLTFPFNRMRPASQQDMRPISQTDKINLGKRLSNMSMYCFITRVPSTESNRAQDKQLTWVAKRV